MLNATKKNPMREKIKFRIAVRDSLYKLFPYFKPKESERMLNPDE